MSNLFSYVIVALLAFIGTKAFDMLEISGKEQVAHDLTHESVIKSAETSVENLKKPGMEECFSSTEVEVLKNLKIRREQLDIRERNIEEKERVLGTMNTEALYAVRQIEDTTKRVEKILKEYQDKKDAQILRLVKIYEGMKPQEAARIFEELNWDILLSVVQYMKESKLSAILAAMNPSKATSLTIALSNKGDIKSLN
ncbi:putative MotE-like protein [Candidatus Cyrtobacter comes]|uniref:MotE-like protein n=1 Tax=Candidatus Cyrtobacter comes TaxID=675776 RepID=A0ABU5L8D4_9RICK|nr:hypothetical protein [Candidatus Cyrtobacter comes]MDZ5762375.1 putative MotE-like protein [Candidatus Cyrtobacter comes]